MKRLIHLIIIWCTVLFVTSNCIAFDNYFSQYQSIPSSDCMDVESFKIGPEVFLAVANKYKDSSPETDSIIYKWDQASKEFIPFQTIPTKGAWDWESFSIEGETYLAVANQVANGLNRNIDSKIYKWNGTGFVEFQSIPTNGALDWEFFEINGNYFLAVANYFNGSSYDILSRIYKWNNSYFEVYQEILTHDAHDWKSFKIDGKSFLAVANAFDGISYNLDSVIYLWDENQDLFIEYQNIPTSGAFDWESFEIAGEIYLAVANNIDGTTGNNTNFSDSKLYKWDDIQEAFIEFQSIPTSSASSFNSFVIDEYHFLFLTQQRDGSSYNTDSILYKWDSNSEVFLEYQRVPTFGAQDSDFLTINNEIHVAIANFREDGSETDSALFKWGNGLVAYYPFNGNANDESGNGHNGTEIGNIQYLPGVFGQAKSFNGTDSFVSINPNAAFETQNLTLSLWVKANSKPPRQYIFSNGYLGHGGQLDNGYHLIIEEQFGVNDLISAVMTDDQGGAQINFIPYNHFEEGVWNYYTFTFDGQSAKTYVNGNLTNVTNQPSIYYLDQATNIVQIGSAASTLYPMLYSGLLDDIRIYNRALSESEVLELYNSSDPTNNPPEFDQIPPQSINEGETLVFAISASDPDGDNVTLSCSSLPSGANFDSSTGLFNWEPNYIQDGEYELKFIATDDGVPNKSNEINVFITVSNEENPDTVTTDLVDQINENPDLGSGVVKPSLATLKNIKFNKIRPAINKLYAFVYKIDDFRASGEIDLAVADYYISIALDIIKILGKDPLSNGGIYVWRDSSKNGIGIDTEEAERLAEFASENNIKTIYYDNWGNGTEGDETEGIQSGQTLSSIIKILHERGLKVQALYTNFDPAHVHAVLEFNRAYPNEQFDGIRFNNESIPDWGQVEEPIAQEYLYDLQAAVWSAGDLPVYANISHHWDAEIWYNGISKKAFEHIIDIVTGIDIQVAQDTIEAIAANAWDEVKYAKSNDKEVLILLETYDVVCNYPGEYFDYNTFYEEGEAVMNEAKSSLLIKFPLSTPDAFAYHFYRQSYGSPNITGWNWDILP